MMTQIPVNHEEYIKLEKAWWYVEYHKHAFPDPAKVQEEISKQQEEIRQKEKEKESKRPINIIRVVWDFIGVVLAAWLGMRLLTMFMYQILAVVGVLLAGLFIWYYAIKIMEKLPSK